MPLFAAIDLGGTTIAAAIADEKGRLVAETEVPTNSHEGPTAVVARIGQLVQKLATRAGSPPQAVGMGIPGLVDVSRGITKFLPNLQTQWRDIPVGDMLRSSLGCPIYLLNDVRTATLGELTYGHGQAAGPSLTMAFFSIGTGIGGGIVIDGRLRLGPLGAAGELGHQTILPDGPRCGCGNHGCLEALASGPAIAAEGIRLMKIGLAPRLFELVGGDATKITPREMLDCGDEAPREAIERAANFIGIAVANVVTILHPELVVLGGGVSELGDILVQPVRDIVHKRVGMFPTDGVTVERSRLGDRAGILGAVALAVRGGAN